MSNKPVTNISVSYNVALVTIENLPNDPKFISDILNAIADHNINIDMISQMTPYKGHTSLSFSMSSDSLAKALAALKEFRKDVPNIRVEVDADNTKLQVYGEGMRNLPGVAAKLFTLLAEEDIEIKLVTTSEVDISYLIYDKDVDRAIAAIEAEFGLS
jgi:aspartokinase